MQPWVSCARQRVCWPPKDIGSDAAAFVSIMDFAGGVRSSRPAVCPWPYRQKRLKRNRKWPRLRTMSPGANCSGIAAAEVVWQALVFSVDYWPPRAEQRIPSGRSIRTSASPAEIVRHIVCWKNPPSNAFRSMSYADTATTAPAFTSLERWRSIPARKTSCVPPER